MKLNQKQNNGSLYIHPSRKIEEIFTQEEIKDIVTQMYKQIKKNDTLFIIKMDKHEVWGLYDTRAGTDGEDLLTLILNEEFYS